MTVRQVLSRMTEECARAGVDCPELSARLLLEHVLGLDHTGLVLAMNQPVAPELEERALELVVRRAAGEPAAYICGSREFYGREFRVTRDTLIPRPETEHIVEEALRFAADGESLQFADLGTGSGCLAVTLAAEATFAAGVALDISPGALAVARANAERLGVADRVLCVCADFSHMPVPDGSLDLVVANPPYVPEAEYRRLSIEVRDHEPLRALTPGPEGLEAVASLAPEAARCLKPGGMLLLEMAWDQGPRVRRLLESAGCWTGVRILPDLAGRDRVAAASRAPECG